MEIEKYRHDLEVIRHTAIQVAKDFGRFGFDIKLPICEFSAYEELQAQLVPILEQLQREQPHTLKQLLYCIDLDEQQAAGANNASELAHRILERELIKVITRMFFNR
jgi:hypothetical protein